MKIQEKCLWIYSLWPSDAILWNWSWSTLVKVMACCLMASSHYMNQCWIIISVTHWHSADGNVSETILDIAHYRMFENYIFQNTATSSGQWINSLWPSDAIWWQRSGSTLAQVMACCLTAPSHYLNQSWLIISKVLRSCKDNFTRDTSAINHQN